MCYPLVSAQPAVHALRVQLQTQLIASCVQFLHEPLNQYLFGKQAERLLALLTHSPDPQFALSQFDQCLRAIIPTGISLVGNFDARRYWALSDAIDHWACSEPGSFGNFDDQDSHQHLALCRDELIAA